MSKENKEFEDFAINRERSKSDREWWKGFEHTLRYLLCELNDKTDREDSFLLDDIKQTIIVFVMKDKFDETNAIFLENMKNDFYRAIDKLEERHSDIKSRTKTVKIFMEDFYFNK